jgi:hypothetical protein
MNRRRVVINGIPHYDKGTEWYIRHSSEYVDRRPASTVSLEEECGPETGVWAEIAEIHGESYY